MNEQKLRDRCIILRRIIIAVSEIYNDTGTNDDQKRLIETIIGAAIWYLPNGIELWTGMISEEAHKKYLGGEPLSKLTHDHQFPRKVAAREVLTDELDNLKKSESRLNELYKTKYGKWNFVTSTENKNLGKYQRDTEFVSSKDSYLKAGIKLIEDKNLLKKKTNTKKTSHLVKASESHRDKTRNVFSKFSDRVEITINNLHTPKTYSLIPLSKDVRPFFPGYNVNFNLVTDIGIIFTKVTSAYRDTKSGDSKAGKSIQGAKRGELKKWYDRHPELKEGATLIISVIEPKKKYALEIK